MHIWARDEVDFLFANKHESFLQVDSPTLGSQVCDICTISQEKREGWSWFFVCR